VLTGRQTIDEIIHLVSSAETAPSVLGALPLPSDIPVNTLWELGPATGDASYWRVDFPGRWLPGYASGTCLRRHLLRQLGVLFVSGLPINWQSFYGGVDRRRRVELPTYPFERKRYWLEPVAATLTDRYGPPDIPLSDPAHPVLGRRLRVAARPADRIFELAVDSTHPLLTAAGSVLGSHAATEAALCEFAIMAVRASCGGASLNCHNANLHERLELKEDEFRIVQVSVQPRGDGALDVLIHSRPYAPEQHSDTKWSLHFTATASP
jgi:acyl transferase domain-containing protein